MDELKIIKRPNNVKKNGNGKNLRLVDRDYAILKFILEMGAASSDVIWIGFFKEEGIGKKYAQNRLSRLRAADYLLSHYTPDGAARWYTATKKARSFVASYYELREKDLPEVRKTIAQGNFFHDKGMCLIRSMLKAKGQIEEGSFKSDYLLRSLSLDKKSSYSSQVSKNIPDGVYENSEGIKIALEYERNAKSHKNILNKFSGTEDYDGSDCVLFVFASEIVKKTYLTQLKKKGFYRKAFVFMTYDEFVNEYENEFSEFDLLKYVPDFVKQSINDALNEGGYLVESQKSWSVFLKDQDVEFLDHRDIERRREWKKQEERQRIAEAEEEMRYYRKLRNEYIAWKEKGVLSKVLESEPRKVRPRHELDQEDGVVGWWQ